MKYNDSRIGYESNFSLINLLRSHSLGVSKNSTKEEREKAYNFGAKFSLGRWKEECAPYLDLKNIHEKRVLDLGCGFCSEFILNLKRSGYVPREIIHLDADPKALTRDFSYYGYPHVDQNLLNRILYDRSKDTLIVANIESIPLKDASVDIIHEYMLSPSDYEFMEICRILKNGGIFFYRGGEIRLLTSLIENRKFEKLGKSSMNSYCEYEVYKRNSERFGITNPWTGESFII